MNILINILDKTKMGIKNLNKFLRSNCPEVYKEVHISEYAFKKVAIDISLYLCKYKIVCGEDKWLGAFINLIASLRRNEVHCVFIYDSGAPPEKSGERAERAASKEKLKKRVFDIEEALNHYYNTNEVEKLLLDLCEKAKNKHKRLLVKTPQKFDLELAEKELKRIKGYILNIRSEDFLLTKELFNILAIPYFDAPLEAETMCADLCKRGLVDAVLSEDTDVLAYESPMFLSKIDTRNDTCVQIEYSEVISSLELTNDQFLDLCIMCGTDYNKNIHRVGPQTSYKYIKKHKSIEGIKANTELDISVLHHIRGRELFRDYERADVKILYCGKPDFEALKTFINKYNVDVKIDKLQKAFIKNIIIFDE
jgi:flap endonuclease-1